MSAYDLVLSSGFLAFARQVGFLKAVEASGIEVDGVCGTSSGALAGALWAAGHPSSMLAEELSKQTPWSMMRLHGAVWRGLFSMDAVVSQLRQWLPSTFADLDRPFGVGVCGPGRRAMVLTDGPLPEAVAASCAIPGVFAPIRIGGVPYSDGGVVDRTALEAWRSHRGCRSTVLHLVERTSGAEISADAIPADVKVVRTPRSGARFWNLGDFHAQVDETYAKTIPFFV